MKFIEGRTTLIIYRRKQEQCQL